MIEQEWLDSATLDELRQKHDELRRQLHEVGSDYDRVSLKINAHAHEHERLRAEAVAIHGGDREYAMSLRAMTLKDLRAVVAELRKNAAP